MKYSIISINAAKSKRKLMSEKIPSFYNLGKAQDEASRVQTKAKKFSVDENKNLTNSDYQKANDLVNEENRLFQGIATSKVFEGRSEKGSLTIKHLYAESAAYFAEIIKNNLPENSTPYTFADFGSAKGELLKNVLNLLKSYHFHTLGIDTELALKENDVAQEKISANLTQLPLEDKSIDLAMMRYVLQWNNQKNQQNILQEIARVIKGFAIVQHVGADNINTDLWRHNFNDVLAGQEVPKLERHGHFVSSREEIETWMKAQNINFQRLSERKVDRISDVLIERYALNEDEADTTRKILADKDYIIQTTWLIFPNKEPDNND